MSERILMVCIDRNTDVAIAGDVVLNALTSDDRVVKLDNWYSDERTGPHVGEYECIGKSVEEVRCLVHQRDVGLIRSWV